MESDLEDVVQLNPSPPTTFTRIESIWDDDKIQKVCILAYPRNMQVIFLTNAHL